MAMVGMKTKFFTLGYAIWTQIEREAKEVRTSLASARSAEMLTNGRDFVQSGMEWSYYFNRLKSVDRKLNDFRIASQPYV
jgi:hypothetical protein